ncbi:MAG: sulfotransferase family protein [Planctomycetes bacterium]|nr:sulfotransferase family protein [Planctomycetota bacterium]MBM4100117.1 sulfotransferase family protein [Planctomycetota bacterium]
MTTVAALTQLPKHLPLIDPSGRFILFWTPRCGSTTLLAWFFEAIGLGGQLKSKSAHALRVAWQSEREISPSELQALYGDKSVAKYVVCRDPFDRIVSSYHLLLERESPQWNGICQQHPAMDSERRVSFRGFLEYLKGVDLDSCDLHWRRQSAQDWHRLRLPVSGFIRTETLESDLNAIARSFGLVARVRRASVTPRVQDATPLDIAGMDLGALRQVLPFDERGRLCFPKTSAFLTAETESIIRDLYRRDFDSLGYALRKSDVAG